MAKASHTPGPWTAFIDEESGEAWDIIPASEAYQHESLDNVRIAQVNSREDAALIAAAPDLLAALETAEAQINEWMGADNVENCIDNTRVALREIGAALAKARP